jgi:hypothetical protein
MLIRTKMETQTPTQAIAEEIKAEDEATIAKNGDGNLMLMTSIILMVGLTRWVT